MFDLDLAVNKWVEEVHGVSCLTTERSAELTDHLYEEITWFQQQGYNPEQAFLKATERLGDTAQLGTEYAKNNSLLATVCAAEQSWLDKHAAKTSMSKTKTSVITLGHSLAFAIAMLITSFVVQDEGTASLILFGVLMPLWFVTFLFLPGVARTAAWERKFIKRKIDQLRTR